MTTHDGTIGALTGLQVAENPYLPEGAVIYNEREIVVWNVDLFYIALIAATEMRTARAFLAKIVGDLEERLFTPKCECSMTPPEMWLSAASCGYGGGYEPGSQWEWNPDCRVHPGRKE